MPSQYEFKSKKMEINFYSIAEAIKIKPTENMALISLIDPSLDGEFEFNNWKYRLQLCFDDCEESEEGIVFNGKMARCVIEFATALPTNVNNLIIHCIAGVSRSSAVVKFLSKHVYLDCFNSKFDTEYQNYNELVYNQLCHVWEKLLKAKEVSAR